MLDLFRYIFPHNNRCTCRDFFISTVCNLFQHWWNLLEYWWEGRCPVSVFCLHDPSSPLHLSISPSLHLQPSTAPPLHLHLSISTSPPLKLSNTPNDAAFQPCSLILSPASFKWRFYILFISGACIIFLERSIIIVQFFWDIDLHQVSFGIFFAGQIVPNISELKSEHWEVKTPIPFVCPFEIQTTI